MVAGPDLLKVTRRPLKNSGPLTDKERNERAWSNNYSGTWMIYILVSLNSFSTVEPAVSNYLFSPARLSSIYDVHSTRF